MDYRKGVDSSDYEHLVLLKNLEAKKHLVTIKTPSLTIQTNTPEKYKHLKGEYSVTIKTRRKTSFPFEIKTSRKGDFITFTTDKLENIQNVIENLC